MIEIVLSFILFSLQPSDTVGCAQFREASIHPCVLKYDTI